MSPESAEVFMRCHRSGVTEGEDPRVQKAVRAAERKPALKTELDEQIKLDERCSKLVGNIALPSSLIDKIAALPEPSEERGFQWRAALKQPPILAAFIALIFLLGWGVYFAMNRLENFPGHDNIEQLIARNDEMSGADFELKTAEVGNLEDWFFSRYQFEDFYVPPQFAKSKTVGCQVFRQNGSPIAELAIGKGQNIDKLFYMFRADNLGVKISPADQWRVFTQENWAVAVQQHEDICFMIALRGSKQQMKDLLAETAPAPSP